jgi:ribose 5-phosphate isomerase
MKRILIIGLLLLSIASLCAIPKWYSSARSTFSSGEWIVGLGTGATKDEALSNAKTDLVQQISVKVQSTTEVQANSIETEGKEFYSESIKKSNQTYR